MILVVDDDRDSRESMAVILEEAGYNVIEAANGHRALDLLEQLEPDLVLVDLTMPLMSGRELVEELHARAELRPFAVVAMSGAVPAGQSPTRWFLHKPMRADLLLAIVGELCGQRDVSPFWGGGGQAHA